MTDDQIDAIADSIMEPPNHGDSAQDDMDRVLLRRFARACIKAAHEPNLLAEFKGLLRYYGNVVAEETKVTCKGGPAEESSVDAEAKILNFVQRLLGVTQTRT